MTLANEHELELRRLGLKLAQDLAIFDRADARRVPALADAIISHYMHPLAKDVQTADLENVAILRGRT